ncbi:hypothetical protein [Sphingopyxis sp. NJF-3]
MTAPHAAAQTAEGPVADADTAIAHTKTLVDPIRRCEPADGDEIVVCGSDTERYRLPPELRAIANEGREAPPKLPRAEAKAMSLDRLPYNWISIGGRYPPGPEYNALYEMAKRATDPETGEPAAPEEEP